jgi:putative hydrolase of the HAD superfamily
VPGVGGRIAAVTLDAAGTLFTVAAPVGETYARIAARHGIERRPAELETRFRAAFRAAPPQACPDPEPQRLGACERGWWRRVVRATLDAPDDPGFDACFDQLFAHFATPGAWRVHPDVHPALAELRARAVRLAVVSNFDRRLGTILTGLGLAPSFDLVLASTAVGAAKPAAAIFARAVAGLGVDAAHALHAGDGLREDVHGARAAGLRAVLVDRTGEQIVPPDVPVVRTLVELLPIVDASGR